MIRNPQYMELLEATQIYFQGEKLEALVFIIPLGLVSMLFGAWLFTDNPSSFAKGVAIPFLTLGLLLITVGSVVGFRTPAQLAGILQVMHADTQAGVLAETQRMIQVNKAWPVYLAIWAVFGVAGLALRFAGTSDFYQGIGIALVFFAGVGMLIDGFAERRTRPYMQVLTATTVIQATPPR